MYPPLGPKTDDQDTPEVMKTRNILSVLLLALVAGVAILPLVIILVTEHTLQSKDNHARIQPHTSTDIFIPTGLPELKPGTVLDADLIKRIRNEYYFLDQERERLQAELKACNNPPTIRPFIK